MSIENASAGESNRTAESLRCIHCSTPIPAGRVSAFCCNACEIVHDTIKSLGLGNYYRLREQSQAAARKPASVTKKDFAFFNEPTFLAQYTTLISKPRELRRAIIFLEGIHCAACIWILEKLPELDEGVSSARVDFSRGTITVEFDPRHTSLGAIATTLHSLGYTPAPIREEGDATQKKLSQRSALIRLGVAGFCTMNVMMLIVSVYQGQHTGIEPAYERLFSVVSLLLTIPVLGYSAVPFYRTAIGGLRSGVLHIDLPIVVAIITAFFYSAFHTIVGSGSIYYDSICALVLLLLSGRFLQQRSIERVLDSSRLLYALSPRSARCKGQTNETFVESIANGAEVVVAPEETIPVDGIIVEGVGHISSAILTGESTPLKVHVGTPVFAGTRVIDGNFVVKVTATGANTRIGHLMTSIEKSAHQRAPLELFLDRVSRGFIAAVLIASAGTFWWWWSAAGLPEAFEYSIALLVVSCPCVLAVATPLTFSLAIAEAARQGILIKSPDALERLTTVETLCLDKTGTLTQAQMRVVSSAFKTGSGAWQKGMQNQYLAVAQALEADNFHPIASAIRAVQGSAEKVRITNYKNVAGIGVEGVVDGVTYRLQSAKQIDASQLNAPELVACREEAHRSGASEAFLCRQDEVLMWFAIADTVRPETQSVLERLERSYQLTIKILSGDNTRIVSALAQRIGIADAQGDMSPEDKRLFVEEEQRQATTAMVGDGVNDAPALTSAAIGIGVHGGAEVCLAVADVYLSSAGLEPLLDLFQGAHRTLSVVKGSLVVSAGYNLVAAAAAMGGVIGPLHAAIIMPISSLSTIGYALLARKFRR